MSLEDLFDRVLKKVPELAQEHLGGFLNEALSDSRQFCIEIEGRLERWLGQYQRGELNRVELERLVRGLISVTKSQLLSEAGIAQVKIGRFFEGLIVLLLRIFFSKIL